ncbi:MAG: 4Fe-4S dicluster domain-containing protein [Verrucomicrobiae bacterium]|nr:4Fe-4S dicluster domain-containing protein [Verrucomicrobiae bacterium]
MARPSLENGAQVVLERAALQHLLDALRQRGYRVVGPTVRENAVVFDEVARLEDLPIGWTDEQGAGTYRLKKQSDKTRFGAVVLSVDGVASEKTAGPSGQTIFGYATGPQSLKKFLHPAEICVWKAKRRGRGFEPQTTGADVSKLALFGVRACDLQTIAVLDRVLMNGGHADSAYKARREKVFVVAVNCARAGGTCFCASMKTGPKATHGFDLAMTEVLDGKRHYFVVEVGSKAGAAVLSGLPHAPAQKAEREAAARVVTEAAQQMGRQLDVAGIKELLYRNYEHPRWDDVAARCLTCGNCTMVCPTCFCNTIEDATDIAGTEARRVRKWDSCFTLAFTYTHFGNIRMSPRSRYRQWLTHKLGWWVDQFDMFGCVGCGRCIAWCPAKIDLTEEVSKVVASG